MSDALGTIRKLIDAGRTEEKLNNGAPKSDEVRALQRLLHELGFDAELNWEQYQDDGDYGGSTTAAVSALLARNGRDGGGERVDGDTARLLVARYESLDELHRLAADIDAGRVDSLYYRRSGAREAVAAMQTLLNDAGFGAELNWQRYGADGDYGGSSAAAVKAFAEQRGESLDGDRLTIPLAEALRDERARGYGDGWRDAVPPESTTLPAEEGVAVRTENSGGKVRVVVSDGAHEKRFTRFKKGIYTYGDRATARFLEAGGERVARLGVTPSALNVALAVAENEGNLDAINTWDNAFLSFGMFQWTAGSGDAKGELPALLARLKATDEELFQRYFGAHGLDVTDTSAGYGRFTIHGETLRDAAAKEQLRGPVWAFRFWLAGQDEAVQAVEVAHALARLDGFYRSDGNMAGGHYIADLVTSEYGVGLLLDNHVNRPAYVAPCLAEALEASGLRDPADWGSEEERRLIDAYLARRIDYGRSPMTDAEKRAEVTRRYLERGTISDERGSFRDQA